MMTTIADDRKQLWLEWYRFGVWHGAEPTARHCPDGWIVEAMHHLQGTPDRYYFPLVGYENAGKVRMRFKETER